MPPPSLAPSKPATSTDSFRIPKRPPLTSAAAVAAAAVTRASTASADPPAFYVADSVVNDDDDVDWVELSPNDLSKAPPLTALSASSSSVSFISSLLDQPVLARIQEAYLSVAPPPASPRTLTFTVSTLFWSWIFVHVIVTM
jgi:hypothetical protein